MSTNHVDGPTRHFTANNNAMDKDLRVVLDSSGYLILAGADEVETGTLETQSEGNAGESVEVRMNNAQGTVVMVANGAAAVNAPAYGAAGGKVSGETSGNFIGYFREAATADGDRVEIQRAAASAEPIDGGIHIDEDFIGDWPASGTALTGQGAYSWTKTETNGLGVTSLDNANGVLSLAFDAVAEAATAAIYMANSPIDPAQGGTAEFLLKVADIGDSSALDINFGLASDTHATDLEATAEHILFHLDGLQLNLYAMHDDGTTDATYLTTATLVQTNFYAFKIDFNNLSDVKLYWRAVGAAAWTDITPTTIDVSNASANWTPIVHIEKTSNDTTAAVHVDRIVARAGRA